MKPEEIFNLMVNPSIEPDAVVDRIDTEASLQDLRDFHTTVKLLDIATSMLLAKRGS